MSFRLTYATMFDPPEAMHERFEAALGRGRGHARRRARALHRRRGRRPARAYASRAEPDRPRPAARGVRRRRRGTTSTPAMRRRAGGVSRPGAPRPVAERAATDAPRRATSWRSASTRSRRRCRSRSARTAWRRSARRRRRSISSAHYADDFEQHAGYEHELPNDPLPGIVSRNRSVMRPYGVWVVIAPFNFPLALAGGPTAAALVTGNTVVVKGATRHALGRAPAGRLHPRRGPAAGRLQLPVRLRPRGRRGPGRASRTLAGITFTGSVPVGMQLLQQHGRRRLSAPVHRRDGRQEPVHRHGAARTSITRPRASCARPTAWAARSARPLSRLYVDAAVADELIERLASADRRDPHRRSAAARELARPGGERQRAYANYAALRRRAAGRRRDGSSPADAQLRERRSRARLLRRARAGRGAARAPAVEARDVPADPHAAPRARTATRRCASPTTPTSA